MHDSHHSKTHHLRLVERLHLLNIVAVYCCCDKLALLSGSQRRWFDVFEGGEVCGLVLVTW